MDHHEWYNGVCVLRAVVNWILTLKVVNHPRESALYPVADQRQNNNDHSNQHKRALRAISQNVCVRTA